MTSRLARLAVVLLLVLPAVVAAPAAVVAAPPGAAPPGAAVADCPGPNCTFVTEDMRCHEDQWCLVPLSASDPVRDPIALPVSIVDIQTTAADYSLESRIVVIPVGAQAATVGIWINADNIRERDELFAVRIGPVTSLITITAEAW
jgi:hypothetical protein